MPEERDRGPADPAAFIRANLAVAPVPGVPEIRLHVAGPASGLWRLAGAGKSGAPPPYWAYHWAGGAALARHVLDRPATVKGRRVLDLGAGSGIVAVAAAMAGAAEVTAADTDPNALVALGLNAALNGVAVAAIGVDIIAGPPPQADIVAVGDLFYEKALAARVTAYLDRCLDAGIEVVVSDPWRAYLPRCRLRLLAEYRVPDFGEAGIMIPAGVFSFEPDVSRTAKR